MRRTRTVLLTLAWSLSACTGGGETLETSVSPSVSSGGTLRLGSVGTYPSALDPQIVWTDTYSTWAVFRCCLLRTLMSYNGQDGPSGVEPKPDLAAAPPDVSVDGLTWTFHLRPGLRYAPPMQDVEITSADIVRAVLRAGDPDTPDEGLSEFYLSNIQGFEGYMRGETGSISGLETPDELTLTVHQIKPDVTLPYRFTLANTAPIPPSPGNGAARYGVATGHDRSEDEPDESNGYGRFLVSSGPYMIEGAGEIDFSLPPAEQRPASGFVPWAYDRLGGTIGYGSLTLVRNPSWDPSTDPLRAALADRIVIEGGPPEELFPRISSGDLAMVFDGSPSPDLLRSYLEDPSRRGSVEDLDTGGVVLAEFNLAEPPFDDLAVRRAVTYALDRVATATLVGRGYGFAATLANHYASDALEQSLASGWYPFPNANGAPNLEAARRAMAESRYARGNRCGAPSCDGARILVLPPAEAAVEPIGEALAALGIHATIKMSDNFFDACRELASHIGMCIGNGWFPDYPSAGNVLTYYFASDSPGNFSHTGATLGQLRGAGYTKVDVPSVDLQIDECNEQVGAGQTACWTRLDQYVVMQVLPAIPLAFERVYRLTSPAIGGFSWDQGFREPALDRLAVASG